MDFKKLFEDLFKNANKGIALGLAVVMFLTVGGVCGMLLRGGKTIEVTIPGLNFGAPSASAPGSTPAAPPVSSGSTSTNNSQGTITEDTESEMSVEEIISLFNDSANKIKTDAVKVVKNYEDRTHMEEYLQVPSAISGLAADLIEENFKDDTDPIEYATPEDIIANFQVPGETWVSQLTVAEVEEAVCVDNGTEYELYIKLYPSVNPEPGDGVAKAFDTITSSEVLESAPSMVKEFTTEYFDCVIRCKINKDSGLITWINYTSPLILKLKVEFFGSLDAQLGMKFEKDYTITY